MEQNLDEQTHRGSLLSRIVNLHPAIKIAGSFVILILLGALLLSLPICGRDGGLSFLDALFTSTSAVCVTGLSVVTIADTFNVFGQVVILLLIQFGGLGFMTIASVLMIVAGKKITLSDRLTLREAYNQDSLSGMVKLTKNIILLTLLIELSGAVLLSFAFVPAYGAKGLYYAVFHSVSAFCNAGFDVLGSTSLIPWQTNVLVTLSVSYLIILGGIGFTVIVDIVRKRRWKRFLTHTKIVLIMTGGLLLFSTVVILLLEYNNPATLGGMNFGQKLLASFVQAVVPRTAGVCSIDQASMSDGSKLVTMLNMFIGASSGSAGGGIKTTTFAILIFAFLAGARSQEREPVVNRKSISGKMINKAVSVVTFALTIIIASIFLIVLAENGNPNIDMESVAFECVSAYSTVGLSYGITPELTGISKLILTALMYIGRMGSLFLTLFFLQSRHKENTNIKYPEMKIMIG